MKTHMRSRTAIVAVASLLAAFPFLVAAEGHESLARRIVDRVFGQLCERQLELGDRLHFFSLARCAPSLPPPALTLVKEVVNDDGGTAVPADFQAMINGDEAAWETTYELEPGEYVVSEESVEGYEAGPWGGDCAPDGAITLAPGENKTCTITNDDIAPEQEGIVINEIAWMGSVVDEEEDDAAEWMELRNLGESAVDLEGWTLAADDGTPTIGISDACANTVIPADGFFLLVRTHDSVAGIPADCTYTGALSNSGELLELRDSSGALADSVDGSVDWEVGGPPQKGDNDTKETAQRADDGTWFTATPTPGA